MFQTVRGPSKLVALLSVRVYASSQAVAPANMYSMEVNAAMFHRVISALKATAPSNMYLMAVTAEVSHWLILATLHPIPDDI